MLIKFKELNIDKFGINCFIDNLYALLLLTIAAGSTVVAAKVFLWMSI